jgi:hypothetical protein
MNFGLWAEKVKTGLKYKNRLLCECISSGKQESLICEVS